MTLSPLRSAILILGLACSPLVFAQESNAATAPADTAMTAPTAETAPQTVAAPTSETATVVPSEANGGTATIVFFRLKKFAGGGMSFKVRENKTELGKLKNGSFFTVQVPAGHHEYIVHSESKDLLTLDAEAGQTYYIQGAVEMGVLVGRPTLVPVDKLVFESKKSGLKEAAPLAE